MFERLCWKLRRKPWVQTYRVDLYRAIMRTQRDGCERGCLIVQNRLRLDRTRIQKGTSGDVTIKMEALDIEVNDDLISFHTHIGVNPRPSLIDRETAIALGETYTCIGYIDNDGYPGIAVWRIKRGKRSKYVASI